MWNETVGLVSHSARYLTAETFGFKVNANGQSLKRKQQWTLEPFPLEDNTTLVDDEENVALKSHLNRYLAVDAFGNVTCEDEERTAGARFTITICSVSQNNNGQRETISWAFRNVSRGYFLGTSQDGSLQCNAKMPQSRAELWHVHLLPARGATMFALKSVGRKRYARATDHQEGDSQQIQVDATSPWGENTLFKFVYLEDGKYGLATAHNRFLTNEGACISVATPTEECLFTLEYHSANVAFRDHQGRYLAAAGRASLLRSRSSHVTKDEQFLMEVAPIQVALRANQNNKWVSTKQGVDLAANQNEVTEKEAFQLEYNKERRVFRISTKDGLFWSVGGATLQTSRQDGSDMRFEWNEDGSLSLSIEGVEDKWICARKSGQLFCGSGEQRLRFSMKLLNRKQLNLRANNASGFLGLRLPGSGKLESNKTSSDPILVEYWSSDSGQLDEDKFDCCLLRIGTKYLTLVENNCLAADASSTTCAQQFQIELRSGTEIALKVFESNSNYVNLTKNGAIVVAHCDREEATKWEI